MTVSGKLITRNYGNFRGVDFSNRKDEVNVYRSPDALNMWKNYKNTSGKCVETRPDIELLAEYSDTIFGLFFYDYGGTTHKIVHSGTNLYDDDTVIYSNMNEEKSMYFIYENKLYIKDGVNYLVYNGTTIADVVGYIPTTSISRSPLGGGTIYEDVNILSPYRYNTFVGDGESTSYYLDAQELDSTYTPEVTDTEGNTYTVTSFDYTLGVVTLNTAPGVPLTDGQDNVKIKFKRTIPGEADKILKSTLLEVFDNRVFFSGNPDYPNYIWHSSLDDPTYCSDLDYYTEGVDDSNIKAIVSGNNALWVLKEPSQSNTTIFYHNPVIDSTYGKIYPSVHSSISTGCVSSGINFNDTICFLSDRGLEAITGDVTTEQTLMHRSSLIDNRLLNEPDYEKAFFVEWEGYLVTIIGNKMYLADSKMYSQVNDHSEYEWFYFEFKQEIVGAIVKNGILYLSTKETINDVEKNRIYTLTNKEETREVESYWTTIDDEFGYPQYQKTTNKKGCVVDIEGKQVTLYAKIDNKAYEKIDEYKIAKGYVVPRIKEKKWKALQLKFYSKKPFNLYSSTLEAYIGSYIKR